MTLYLRGSWRLVRCLSLILDCSCGIAIYFSVLLSPLLYSSIHLPKSNHDDLLRIGYGIAWFSIEEVSQVFKQTRWRRILYHHWDDRFIFKHLCRCKVKHYLSNLLVCFSLIFHDYIAVGLLIPIVFFVTILTCIPFNQVEGDVLLVGEGFPDGFGFETANFEFQTTNVSF